MHHDFPDNPIFNRKYSYRKLFPNLSALVIIQYFVRDFETSKAISVMINYYRDRKTGHKDSYRLYGKTDKLHPATPFPIIACNYYDRTIFMRFFFSFCKK